MERNGSPQLAPRVSPAAPDADRELSLREQGLRAVLEAVERDAADVPKTYTRDAEVPEGGE